MKSKIRVVFTHDYSLLMGCLLLALLLRLLLWTVVWNHPDRAWSPDTMSYMQPALRLLETGAYPSDSALRTPLYPAFIALVYSIIGRNQSVLLLLQVLISTLTVGATWALGIRLVSRQAALLGALLVAIDVASIDYSSYLMTETIFTFLLLVALLAWVCFEKTQRLSYLVLSAALMGLSTLCRPVALYFPALILGYWLVRMRRRIMAGVKQTFLYGLVFATLLTPWIWHNYRGIGLLTISTIQSYGLLYNATALEANLSGLREVREDQVCQELEGRVQEKLANLGLKNTEANRARIETVLATSILTAHPFRYAFLYLKADLRNLQPGAMSLCETLGLTSGGEGTLTVLNRDGIRAAIHNYFGEQAGLLWFRLPEIAMLLMTYLAAVVGAITLARARAWPALVLLSLPLAYYLLLPGPASTFRYRVPVVPYIGLLAGIGLHAFWTRAWSERGAKQELSQTVKAEHKEPRV